MTRCRRYIPSLLRCMALLLPVCLWGQSDHVDEYRVKLAFLYHFAQFIQWPADAFADPSAPLVLCIEGSDPFKGDAEQTLEGRTVGRHPIAVQRLKPQDDPRACHILFVRASEKKTASKILPLLQGTHTLTVGEAAGFAASGGVINFFFEESNLRFEVNLDATTRSPLKFSSKLLSVAKITRSNP